jgi:hypothetical protein
VKESRLLATLLTPSPLSFILSCLCAALVVVGISWASLQSQSFLSPYLSGEYGFTSILHGLNVMLGTAFNSDLSYNIAVICFAALFGLGVYTTIASMRHIVNEAHVTLDEMEYADKRNKGAIGKSLGLRLGLRCVSGVVWLGYAIIFFNGILPFCSSLISTGSTQLISLRSLAAFGLLFLAVHVHIIFVRLIALRPRLFGAYDVIGHGGH